MYKWVSTGCVAAAVLATGCAGDGIIPPAAGTDPTNPHEAGTGSATSQPEGSQVSSQRPILVPPEGGWSVGVAAQTPADATCAAETRRAEQIPLDMILLMDQSGSMGDKVADGRKWDLLVAALRSFLGDPASAGIGIGLVFFGIPDGVDDRGDLAVSCRSADYAQPVVPISSLPESASVVVTSLQAHTPVGGTPTRPALEGVSTYAQTWLALHPDHRVAIVLATDGEPNDCDSTIGSVSALASNAYKDNIATYVVGVGKNLANLDQIAAAGGTSKAYVVDTGLNVAQSFLSAMNAIRNAAALPCQYSIPALRNPDAGNRLDLDQVNVAYSTMLARPSSIDADTVEASVLDAGAAEAGRTTAMFQQAPTLAACSTNWGEWYYDDPKAPRTINLCPATCASVKADMSGEIDVLVGCQTVKIPVH